MTVKERAFSGFAVSLLSTDVTSRFLGRMGLGIEDHARFRARIRSLAARNICALDPMDGRYAAALSVALFECVSDEFGSPVGKRFQLWYGEALFPEAHRNYWSAYGGAFSPWAAGMRRGAADELQLGPKCGLLLCEYNRAMDMSDVMVEIEAVKGAPLSAWDTRMYEAARLDNDEAAVIYNLNYGDDTVTHYPFDPIVDAIECYRFQMFWETALGILDDAELARVKAVAETLWMSPLPEPRTFRYSEWPSPSRR